MNKLIAALVAGLFASSVFAQATVPSHTNPSVGLSSGTSATVATPLTKADVKADAKAEKAEAKAQEKAAKADAKADKKVAKADAKAKKDKAEAKADAAKERADAAAK
jgi:Skp family chaperone for outer membrane proteins